MKCVRISDSDDDESDAGYHWHQDAREDITGINRANYSLRPPSAGTRDRRLLYTSHEPFITGSASLDVPAKGNSDLDAETARSKDVSQTIDGLISDVTVL